MTKANSLHDEIITSRVEEIIQAPLTPRVETLVMFAPTLQLPYILDPSVRSLALNALVFATTQPDYSIGISEADVTVDATDSVRLSRLGALGLLDGLGILHELYKSKKADELAIACTKIQDLSLAVSSAAILYDGLWFAEHPRIPRRNAKIVKRIKAEAEQTL